MVKMACSKDVKQTSINNPTHPQMCKWLPWGKADIQGQGEMYTCSVLGSVSIWSTSALEVLYTGASIRHDIGRENKGQKTPQKMTCDKTCNKTRKKFMTCDTQIKHKLSSEELREKHWISKGKEKGTGEYAGYQTMHGRISLANCYTLLVHFPATASNYCSTGF